MRGFSPLRYRHEIILHILITMEKKSLFPDEYLFYHLRTEKVRHTYPKEAGQGWESFVGDNHFTLQTLQNKDLRSYWYTYYCV